MEIEAGKIVEERRVEEQAIEPVEYAAVSGQNIRRILRTRAAFQREFDGFSKVLTITGAASVGISVPLHFAADGMLSRAVWWHNRRYSR